MKRLHLFLAAVVIAFFSCSRNVNKAFEIDPAFGEYISGFTAGTISKASSVRIRLAADYAGEIKLNEPLKEDYFDFSPSIKGKTYWLDSRTLEFVPDQPLPSGESYQAEFNLGELMEVPGKFETFNFSFKTRALGVFVKTNHPETYSNINLSRQYIEGEFFVTDVADSAKVKNILSASQNGKPLKVQVTPNGENKYSYVIHNVVRSNALSHVDIQWSGKAIGADFKGGKKVSVPALGQFFPTDITVEQQPEQVVKIHFSDPLDANQVLLGLVSIEGSTSTTTSISGHNLYVFPSYRLTEQKQTTVYAGIRNYAGKKTANERSELLTFEDIKPAVRILGKGAIIPNTQGTVFPFEAVNLKAVEVHVTQIFEKNVVQFLQINNFNGGTQLKRVGREVKVKTVRLDENSKLNLHEWNRFNLDISTIVKVEPGAIYNIELKFKKEHSAYECGSDAQNEENMASLDAPKEEEWTEDGWGSLYDGYWSEGYEYEDYYFDGYDYSQRENPCNASYYSGKSVSQNVLASDLGIIAKAGSDKNLHVIVSDLRTTDPLSGVQLEYYDFQQQKIGSANTDGDGMAVTKLKSKPFIIVAKKGNQRGYLTLRDGEALSLSKFDVSGATTVKGVKGFPYTERGVYRPGDSIYLSFMLEDKEKVLPQNHPVVMELRNPSGVVVQKIVRTKQVNGLFDFRTATVAEDPTGYWTAKFMVGNREFYHNIRVETIKPNRLKLYLDFGGKDKLSALDENIVGKVSAKWLHGAPARNMTTMVEMTLNGGYTSFEKFKDYTFDNPTKTFASQQMTLFDGQLDESGEATFDVKINAGQNAPGMLKAFFTTRVFEKGGDFSIDQSSLTYSPYTHYVGVKVPEGEGWNHQLVTDKDHLLEFATVDANGKPVSRKIEVKIYKVENHWWWDSYNQNDIMTFITNNGIVAHQSATITTQNGKGTFKMRVNKPTWGNFLVLARDVESNHTTGSRIYVDWPYGSRENANDKENATMLTFATDKKTYQVGEQITVTIPSPAEGRALVSIESGTRIISKTWVETEKGESKYTFEATEEMAPTAYVNITLVQPHAQVKNDLPIRLYGVVPVNVENKDSHLNPVIKSPEVFKPESTPTITVSEKDGKSMTYTLAIVDEGLLDLTNFKTPNPWEYFYSRDALGVNTWDLYDNVLGSYAVKMDELLAIGGDGEAAAKGEGDTKANRFKPMVYFAGPFELKGGTATHKVKIPNYVGSVRVMVVAGQNRAYGNAEKTVPVRSPLMVLGTLPRVLGPGEEVELPVNVFAMEKHVKNVSIEVQANDMFTFKNGKSRSLVFNKPGDEVINFPALVANRLGVGKVTVIARSGKETAKHEIEIQVRSPNPKITDAYETVIDPGKQWNAQLAFNGLKGSNFASIEVSTIPPVNLGERLKYLVDYPHGCIEQTTSAAFPQLYLSRIMDLDDNFKKEIKKNIQATIKRIGLFQTSNGGFSYWPGQSDASPWGTTYATHFLLEAEAAGYKIPSSIKQNALDYLKNRTRNFRLPAPKTNNTNEESPYANEYGYDYGYEYSNDTYDQAYRLFVLALAKQADLGAMNRLREYSKLATEEKWRLAAAYQLAGQGNVAKQITTGLTTHIPAYSNPGYTFGSDVRDRAMILETMVLMKNKTAAALLARELSKELNRDVWMSTQTTAYCLLAMSKFAGIAGASREINVAYTVNGKATTKKIMNVMYQERIDGNKLSANSKMNVKNNGKGLLYVRVVVEKIPMAGDSIRAVNNNIALSIRYTDIDGQQLKVDEIEQGTDFVAEVSISNPGSRGYLTEMALNQIFPSGWEIHNTRMDNFESALQTDLVTYQDFRDDRVYSYYNIGASASKTIRIRLNAAYVGRYYLPTVVTEAMYDNSIYARIPGRWVSVVPAGSKKEMANNP